MTAWERLDRLLETSGAEGEGNFDVAVQLSTVTECLWECALRYTPDPDRAREHGPDVSIVFYRCHGDAETALADCLDCFDERIPDPSSGSAATLRP